MRPVRHFILCLNECQLIVGRVGAVDSDVNPVELLLQVCEHQTRGQDQLPGLERGWHTPAIYKINKKLSNFVNLIQADAAKRRVASQHNFKIQYSTVL